jgi:TolA-binding protein
MYAAAFEQFERDHKAFDSLLNLFHKGSMAEMPIEPKPPRLNHDQSIRDFRAVTEAYPNNPFTAALRYSLAWCYNDIGQLDSALHQMTLITSAYPECPFTAQAWMFLGEYYFERSLLGKAIAAYKTVLRYPESDYFNDALYKLAWTHYRLSNPEKAISSFLALVDLGKIDKSGKALLETESMDYIAISFSESDVTGEKGLERAIMFCKKLNDPEKGTKIVHRLAQVYEEQGRFELAKKTYTTILQMFPAYKMNPGIEAKLVKLMERELTTEQVNVHKLDFFKKYNYSGQWARQQKDTSVIRKADSIACVLLYDASITYHQLALQKSDTVMYGYAMDAYKNFIHYYPKSPVANECHYNLAEILFSIGKYGEAALEYIAVSKRYPDSKYKETAAWNAIVASQNLLKQEQRNR